MFKFFITCYTSDNWPILCIFFSGGKYMVTNDRGAVSIKHAVMEGLARELWEHDEITPDAENQLIMSISPGPHATWRCCVYKEREILRWRIRLSENLDANPYATYRPSIRPARSVRCPLIL